MTKRIFVHMNAAITRSVNAAGQALYNRLGSDAPLRNLFLSLGVNGIKYSGDGRWGNTRLSAAQLLNSSRDSLMAPIGVAVVGQAAPH